MREPMKPVTEWWIFNKYGTRFDRTPYKEVADRVVKAIGEDTYARRVRVTDAACPVARAERAVVKAAEAWLSERESVSGLCWSRGEKILLEAMRKQRAATRRRP